MTFDVFALTDQEFIDAINKCELTDKTLAVFLGVSVSNIWRWRARRGLPGQTMRKAIVYHVLAYIPRST